MDIRLEDVELALDGPLEAAGLPAAMLYGVVLTFLHGGRQATAAGLARVLEVVAGAVEVRTGWLRDSLTARGRLALDAEVGRREARVVARQRLKAARVAGLVDELHALGARELRLRAQVQRFAAPGSGDGPMLDG